MLCYADLLLVVVWYMFSIAQSECKLYFHYTLYLLNATVDSQKDNMMAINMRCLYVLNY